MDFATGKSLDSEIILRLAGGGIRRHDKDCR